MGSASVCACVTASPGPRFELGPGAHCCPLTWCWGRVAPRALPSPPHRTWGAVNQPVLPASPAHLLCAPRPRLPLVLWGRQRGKQSETERGLLSRRETRDTWELAEEACEAGQTPGQPGTDWGLPGGQRGRGAWSWPWAHGQNSARGRQAWPVPCWVVLRSLPSRGQPQGPPGPGGPGGVAHGPCHLLGIRTAGWAWNREAGHLAALTLAPHVTEGIWFISSVHGEGCSLRH